MRPLRTLSRTTVLAAGLLAACTMEPDYQRPDLPVAPNWPTGPGYETIPASAPAAVGADAIGWRDFFKDRRLQALIQISLENNRDLRQAIYNVEAAQSQFRVQRADLFPAIALTGEGTYENPSDRALGATPGAKNTLRNYSAGVAFTSFEIDLFGRERSLTHQAFEQYLSYDETRRSTQISLVSEVASAYLTLLADQQLLELTKQTLESQTASYNLTKATVDLGTGTLLTLRQAETAVDTAKANLAQYTRQVAQDENALTLLLGRPMPADLPPGLPFDAQGLLADLPPGLPSEILTRRPDVMAAEHTLIGANAQIGAARAAFFPSITLTGQAGYSSTQLSKLFTTGAGTWSFVPDITIPIFTWGQNEGNLDLAKAEKNIDVAAYEKTIQTAFREVSDGLAARGTYTSQIAAESQLVDAYADSYRLSTLRFRAGVDNYLSTLDAQRSLYSSQQTLIVLRQQQLSNLVTLYKALGGGWNEHTVQTPPRANPPAAAAPILPSMQGLTPW